MNKSIVEQIDYKIMLLQQMKEWRKRGGIMESKVLNFELADYLLDYRTHKIVHVFYPISKEAFKNTIHNKDIPLSSRIKFYIHTMLHKKKLIGEVKPQPQRQSAPSVIDIFKEK